MLSIRTNHQWREFTYRWDVPERILKSEFDWTDDDDADGYFQYKGYWYHVSQFMRTDLEGWHGIHNDSFFSGVLIRLADDGERFQVATFCSNKMVLGHLDVSRIRYLPL